jgi:hypothetical protein
MSALRLVMCRFSDAGRPVESIGVDVIQLPQTGAWPRQKRQRFEQTGKRFDDQPINRA